MIEVRDVTKRYGGLTAVNHVNFSVGPGEVLGYLGPNGSGKSTTVKMLVGLMPPTSGTILFDGEDIQDDLIAYKAQVGYVPEEAHVYTYLTGPEYLRLAGRLRGMPERRSKKKIDRFLAALRPRHRLPRAAVCVLEGHAAEDPALGRADAQPAGRSCSTSRCRGLDVSTALVLRTVVRTLAADGRIIFYSSHELDTIEKISTRVMILHEGIVVADDSACPAARTDATCRRSKTCSRSWP